MDAYRQTNLVTCGRCGASVERRETYFTDGGLLVCTPCNGALAAATADHDVKAAQAEWEYEQRGRISPRLIGVGIAVLLLVIRACLRMH
jgi:hypothetical protein